MTRIDREILSISELPKGARVMGHTLDRSHRRVQVVMPDGLPRTYTLVAERRQGRWEVTTSVGDDASEVHVSYHARKSDALREAGALQSRKSRLLAAGQESTARFYIVRQVREVQA